MRATNYTQKANKGDCQIRASLEPLNTKKVGVEGGTLGTSNDLCHQQSLFSLSLSISSPYSFYRRLHKFFLLLPAFVLSKIYQ